MTVGAREHPTSGCARPTWKPKIFCGIWYRQFQVAGGGRNDVKLVLFIGRIWQGFKGGTLIWALRTKIGQGVRLHTQQILQIEMGCSWCAVPKPKAGDRALCGFQIGVSMSVLWTKTTDTSLTSLTSDKVKSALTYCRRLDIYPSVVFVLYQHNPPRSPINIKMRI